MVGQVRVTSVRVLILGRKEILLAGAAGNRADIDVADHGGDLADFERFQPQGTDGGPDEAGGSEPPAPKAIQQNIYERSHQEPELIGP